MKNWLFVILLFGSFPVLAQPSYTPTPANLEARQWFQDARFGLFIHWGPSSILGSGEWVMNNRNIHVGDYQRLQQVFNPIQFNAQQWVKMAKDAGMKYITFITRHHDGFSLWDTKASEWNITNTPYKKDILKMLADECQKQDMKLFLYYSILDWYRSDYQYETGRTGQGTGRTAKSDWPSYIRFMKAQLTELLTNYGPIGGIWFDGHWDQLENDKDKKQVSKVNWHYDEIYPLIHKLQPQCLIGNNHHLLPLPGEDFQMFEKDLPGKNTTGFGGADISPLPLETCETINDSWGFNITDRNYKSTEALIHYLVKAAGYGSNFLLNIGPMPNGNVQTEFKERLAQIGEWLKENGETIYGTRGGFLTPTENLSITAKDKRFYIHLLKKGEEKLFLKVPGIVKSLKTKKGNKAVAFNSLPDNYIMIDLSSLEWQPMDTILEMEVQ